MRYREIAKFDKIREKNISKFFYLYKYCDFQNNYNLKDYLFLENCVIAREQNLTKLEKKIYFFFYFIPIILIQFMHYREMPKFYKI